MAKININSSNLKLLAELLTKLKTSYYAPRSVIDDVKFLQISKLLAL